MTRKKYLIVAMEMGDSAPGTVFKTLAKSLYQYADLDIISPIFDENFSLDGIKKVKLHHYRFLDWDKICRYWEKYRFNPKDKKWVYKNLPRAIWAVLGQKYDAVITFTSMNYFPSIDLGRKLAKFLGVKWAIYTVDGIPSPVEWLNGNTLIHSLLSHYLNKACRKADYIFSSNEYMMGYQQKICHEFQGKWGYLYTPHKQKQTYEKTAHEGYRFLYTGALYGLRRIDGLLAGFRRFIKEHPGSQLIFVGDVAPTYLDNGIDLIESKNLILHPFTQDLSAFYQEADVLLDIAAKLDNDVFLSSKIISYLPIDRPILAISGNNSPSRGIMGGIDSILHCHDEENDAYNGLCRSIEAIGKGIDDRAQLIQEFDAETIAKKLYDSLQ